MEACGFDNPYLWPLLHDQGRTPLLPHIHGENRLGSHNCVPHAVVVVKRVHNICLRQNHQVVVPNLNRPGGFGGGKATAVPIILTFEVYPWEAGWLEP